jgi:ABC-type molybdenum transport system ATPase subunit/photorepair protein PhrA
MSLARSATLARDVLLDRPTNNEENENRHIRQDQGDIVDENVGDTVARQWLQLRDDQLSRPFYELSQGEQKLVLIASAIAKLPELLIIDEPLQGLDLRNRRLVLGLVERLCRATDVSLIYVTHHLEELVPSISHVLHLQKGRSIFNDVVTAYKPNEF